MNPAVRMTKTVCTANRNQKVGAVVYLAAIAVFHCIAALPSGAEELAGAKPIEPKSIQRIAPGTVVFDQQNRGYSNLILFIRGKLEAGDTEVINGTTRYYGDLFNLVYMANVKKVDDKFRLDRVAVGFSSKINGKDVVVNSETAGKLGLSLNMIGKAVLSGNERALKDITVVAKNDQCAVIDAPAIVRFNNRNELMVIRFFIWASEIDGRVGSTIWLLAKSTKGYQLAEKTFNFLPPEMVEDRVLYVDGSQFTLGIPSATAFAMTSIPQGRPYEFTERMRRVAAADSFTTQAFYELIGSVAEALGQGG